MLEEYERSGMSGAAFAEKYGIKYTTLASWIQKKGKRLRGDQKAAGVGNGVEWVEAVMAEQRDHHEEGGPLIVRMGGGAVMEIADQKGAKLAAQVLRHLGEAR